MTDIARGSPNVLGTPRVHLRRTSSTNERARELAAGKAPHGTLVTAAEQTAGRGRHGRRWWAPAGSSLLMSLILREVPALLPLAAAVAVCDVVGSRARIKWPNDIVFERGSESSRDPPELAKLAGILIEGKPQEGWVVLGIGLNVAVSLKDLPPELRGTVATMGQGREAIEPELQRLLGALEARLHEPAELTLEAWRTRDVLRGREVAWTQGASGAGDAGQAPPSSAHGRAQGIDGAGRLIVRSLDGRRTTLEGSEVHLIAPDRSRASAAGR